MSVQRERQLKNVLATRQALKDRLEFLVRDHAERDAQRREMEAKKVLYIV